MFRTSKEARRPVLELPIQSRPGPGRPSSTTADALRLPVWRSGNRRSAGRGAAPNRADVVSRPGEPGVATAGSAAMPHHGPKQTDVAYPQGAPVNLVGSP